MIILGVDPGAKGGLAWVEYPKRSIIRSMPMPMSEGELDASLVHEAIEEWETTRAVIERVRSMPKQGVASTFQFGRVFGALEAVLNIQMGAETTYKPTPAKWKGDLQVPADKNMMLNMANAHFPGADKNHWPAGPRGGTTAYEGVAEAALLTLWLAKELKL